MPDILLGRNGEGHIALRGAVPSDHGAQPANKTGHPVKSGTFRLGDRFNGARVTLGVAELIFLEQLYRDEGIDVHGVSPCSDTPVLAYRN
jgi:hypothetical protein